MVVYAYDAGQRHALTDPIVYPGGLDLPCNEVYGYHDGGQRSLVWARTPMAASATATSWDSVTVSWTAPGAGADSYRVLRNGTEIYSGADLQTIDAGRDPATAYSYTVEAIRGGTLFQTAQAEATTPAYPAASLNASATAYNSVSLSWTALDGSADTARLKRSSTTIYTGAGTSHTDSGRSASTTYSYTLTHERSGLVLATATDSAATPARPTTTKTVTLSPSSAGSYNGSGSRRNTGGPYYSGRYSSTWGRQQSAFHFAIPADVRNCIAIDKVEFAVQNDHSYSNGGVTQHIAISHTQTAGSTIPGSTGLFGAKATSKDGWWGGSQWQNITNLKDPTFNATVAENFRSKGAWGIHLKAPNDDIGYYSYWRAAGVQLRITYRIYS
jgi:hypothetical protein